MPPVVKLPPVTLPVAVTKPPVVKLPPVTLPVAVTKPAVRILPPMTFPVVLDVPVTVKTSVEELKVRLALAPKSLLLLN